MSKEVIWLIALENRFYSNQEMSEIVGISNHEEQFARDVKALLKKEGYAFEHQKRKGYQILSRTVTSQMELKELLVERLGLDPQVNPVDFAWFIKAVSAVKGFAAMPYATKESVLSELCGHNIDDGTLRRWTSKLYASENACRGRKDALWHTYRDKKGIKRQEEVDPDSEEYQQYCALRASLLQKLQNESHAYGTMIKTLYGEHGYYYWCPEIMLNALGDDIEKIIHLVDEITYADP